MELSKMVRIFNTDVDVKNLDISKILDLLPWLSTLDLKG